MIQQSILETHMVECEKKKKDKALRKKQAREAKIRREKEAAAAAAAASAADDDRGADGDALMEDGASETAGNGEPSSAIGPDGTPISKSAKKSTLPKDSILKLSKKRKAENEATNPKEPKKKKSSKKETAAASSTSNQPNPNEPPKSKLAKPKGPVDVERQCGVPLPNGGFCARSLTCKSHSMGAKRSVPGRSLPYDILLNQYQKKNQAKQQKAALDANAPLPDEPESGPVDSETERDAVMAAMARRRPKPLAQHTHIGIRQRYTNVRLRDLLGSAFPGRGLGGGGIFGGRTEGSGEGADEAEERMASMPGRSAFGAGSRRSSVIEGQA